MKAKTSSNSLQNQPSDLNLIHQKFVKIVKINLIWNFNVHELFNKQTCWVCERSNLQYECIVISSSEFVKLYIFILQLLSRVIPTLRVKEQLLNPYKNELLQICIQLMYMEFLIHPLKKIYILGKANTCQRFCNSPDSDCAPTRPNCDLLFVCA